MSALHTKVLSFIDSGFIEDSCTTDELIEALIEFDTLYAGEEPGQESPITDGQYDALYTYTKVINPTNKYFTGVGSSVRGGKVDLPYEMGSLNQVQIGDIAEWVKKNNLQKSEVVASDKMDGTSALLLYQADGSPQIAYSRGDGVQGADISRHIFKIKGVPKTCPKVLDNGLTVRAEVELTETAFQSLYDAGIRRRGGDAYKNSRNMVAGLMNSKTIPDICYEYLSVICYEVVGIPTEKKMQLRLLEANGFQVVKYIVLTGAQLTDDYLAKFLNERRDDIDYAIDGLVIEVNDTEERKRMNPTKDTLNPGYAIKYKVADASNHAVAIVVGVNFAVSKHGYIKPTIEINPVELVGVTVTNCTGFNMKYIYDNKIQPGTKINLTRSGDVIPTCLGVVEPGELK